MSRFRKAPNDVFVSTDIEADGPVPGLNSMLSLGSVVYDEHGELLSTFSVNLETLPEAKPDPTTSAWWQERPEAWEQARKQAQPPQSAMTAYREWLRGLEGRPICVSWPASFDFAFVNYYLVRFTGEAPFSGEFTEVREQVLSVDPVPPSERVDGLTPAVDDIISKAMAKQKLTRYETVEHLIQELAGLREAT